MKEKIEPVPFDTNYLVNEEEYYWNLRGIVYLYLVSKGQARYASRVNCQNMIEGKKQDEH